MSKPKALVDKCVRHLTIPVTDTQMALLEAHAARQGLQKTECARRILFGEGGVK